MGYDKEDMVRSSRIAVQGRGGEGIRRDQGEEGLEVASIAGLARGWSCASGGAGAWVGDYGLTPNHYPCGAELYSLWGGGGATLRQARGATSSGLPHWGGGGAPRPAGGAAGQAAQPGCPGRGGHPAGTAEGAGHLASG